MEDNIRYVVIDFPGSPFSDLSGWADFWAVMPQIMIPVEATPTQLRYFVEPRAQVSRHVLDWNLKNLLLSGMVVTTY